MNVLVKKTKQFKTQVNKLDYVISFRSLLWLISFGNLCSFFHFRCLYDQPVWQSLNGYYGEQTDRLAYADV